MSSHHIVRDEQEPAVLVTSAGACLHWLEDLLAWSPLVAVTSSALPEVARRGIKIDIAICQAAHAAATRRLLAHQHPVAVYTCQQQALQTGLDLLLARGVRAINLLADVGPDYLPRFTELALKVSLVVYGPGYRAFYRSQGHFSKWLAAGARLSVIPADLTVDASNLHPATDKGNWTASSSSMVAVAAPRPFWVAEYR